MRLTRDALQLKHLLTTLLMVGWIVSCGGGGGGGTVDDGNNNKPPAFVNTDTPGSLTITNDHSLRLTGNWSDADDGKGDSWSVEWFCDRGKLSSDGPDVRIAPLPAKVSDLPVADGLKINAPNRKSIIKWEPPDANEFCHFTLTMRVTDKGGAVKETLLRRVYNYPLAANRDPDLILMRPMPFDPRGFVKNSHMAVELIILNTTKPLWDGVAEIWWDAYACTPANKTYKNSFVDWGGRMTKANPQTYTPGGLDPWEPQIISQDRVPWQENPTGTDKEMDDDYGINWLASTNINDYHTLMPRSLIRRTGFWDVIIKDSRNKTDVATYMPNPEYPGIVAKMTYGVVNNNKPVDKISSLDLIGGFQAVDNQVTVPAGTTGIASNFVVTIDTDLPFYLGFVGRITMSKYPHTAYRNIRGKDNQALETYRYQIVKPIKQ